MFHGMAERRCGIDGGVYFASRRLHVGFETLDRANRGAVRPLFRGQRARGFVPFVQRACGRITTL